MSNDNDNLMSSRPVSALTDEDLERKRTQDRASQRRCREKKKQNALTKIDAERHAGNKDTHNVDSTAKKRKHEDDDITNHGTHDVDGESRVNPSGQDVDLSTVVEKVARKSVRDDGSREENMDVADVGAAVEDIGNNGHTDIVGNTTTGNNNNNDDGVTGENAAGHNDGAVREATVNNNSLSQNSQRGSRRTTGRSHNDGITSKNATGHNNGAVRQGTVNNNSSSDNSRHSTTTCR